jgi:hypothetical protein
MDAETGQVVAAALTTNDVDDSSQVGPLLDEVTAQVALFTTDGVYEQESVSAAFAERHPDALVIVASRSAAVTSEAAERANTAESPSAEHHRARKSSTVEGVRNRIRAEATIGRFKQVTGCAAVRISVERPR